MNRFLAEFVSPRVSSLHYSDPTINVLRLDEIINEKINFNTEINVEILKSITHGESVDIDFNESQKLRILSLFLGNQEINDRNINCKILLFFFFFLSSPTIFNKSAQI